MCNNLLDIYCVYRYANYDMFLQITFIYCWYVFITIAIPSSLVPIIVIIISPCFFLREAVLCSLVQPARCVEVGVGQIKGCLLRRAEDRTLIDSM